MPTTFDDDQTPIIQFDQILEISPFFVFRKLRDGRPMCLVDVREKPSRYTLEGAVPWSEDWEPPTDRQVVLFDDDGTTAISLARRYHEREMPHVKALFGGLELWQFSLDPEVVGEETYLRKV